MDAKPRMKKARSDSRLKTLPPERQEAVGDFARTHSLDETVKWLAQDGIKTNRESVSQFLVWRGLQAQFAADASTVDAMLEEVKRSEPSLGNEEINRLGSQMFSLMAIRDQDLEGFVTVRSALARSEIEREKLKLRQAAEQRQTLKLKLEREKWENQAAEMVLAKAVREAAEKIANSECSHADKIRAMRLELFRDVDALEESGKVVLPVK